MNVERGEALSVLRKMPAMSIDLTLTDPPYFLPAQHYSARSRWPRSMADLSILEHFFRDVFAEIRRVSKPAAPIAVFCDGQSYPVFYSLLYPHWDRLIDVVWDKEEVGMGSGVRRQHEWIVIGSQAGWSMNGWERSVLRERRVGAKRSHPAEKPVTLLRRLVRLLSPCGGLVLDPFAGSASTGEAATAEGRTFHGIELDSAYATMARDHVGASPSLPGLASREPSPRGGHEGL